MNAARDTVKVGRKWLKALDERWNVLTAENARLREALASLIEGLDTAVDKARATLAQEEQP